jgi:hypothetical protein
VELVPFLPLSTSPGSELINAQRPSAGKIDHAGEKRVSVLKLKLNYLPHE